MAPYARNPVVLLHHDPRHPVGRAEVALRGGRLVARLSLAAAGVTAAADHAAALVAAGLLEGLSVGVLRARVIDGGVVEVTRGRLLELSLTPVPADPGALRLG